LLVSLPAGGASSLPGPVSTIRVCNTAGRIELGTAVPISPRHALAICTFSPEDSISVETSRGFMPPDSLFISPDLGTVLMKFTEDVFDKFSEPSISVPAIGEDMVIVGQGLEGVITVKGKAIERFPDGSFLVSAPPMNGLMGAAVFSAGGDYWGMISGLIRPGHRFPTVEDRDYLVLYPSQVWYMWAKLTMLEQQTPPHRFGVTALSGISLSPTMRSGIQIVSVAYGSPAWLCGLRPGDLITHVDGTPVYHPETLRGLLLLSEDTLEALVSRDGLRFEIVIPPMSGW